MADLATSEFRTVIEDIRVRQAALVTLIYATDVQAMALLRLYATLGIATVSGAIAGLSSSSIISQPLGLGLIASTVVLMIGAALCLRALKADKISLPGRTSDFWIWASLSNVERDSVLAAYLKTAEEFYLLNRGLNIKTANALKWAKHCSVFAPGAALLVGVAATRWPL